MVTLEDHPVPPLGGSNPGLAGVPETGELDDVLRSLPGMQTVIQTIRDLAGLEVPVLIQGEPGAGVDFVAREIHSLSQRRLRPFSVVSCAGVSESNLASQLWGYDKGAFPGATVDHLGLFELADGGTVSFEEVRDIPFGLQIQLARLIRTGEIARIAQSQSRRVNVRLIFGTEFNLVQETASGRVYADLLYRIRVAQIQLPPLRERLGDVAPLATFCLHQSRLLPDKPLPNLSDEAMGVLLRYSWPGNMTELQSTIQFAALRCRGSTITAADLPREIRVTRGTPRPPSPAKEEKERFRAAMGAAKGNRTLAARLLGISRATLYRRLKELGVGTRGQAARGVSCRTHMRPP
ncbi:MAG TPA: sigma 54-interacting transcriptional regulator [Phycisphaerae bacterium]|nr:sigma 54-interacting transcriptional regulator [Phycisphaerae bacterium]HRY70933.1 sigma 54-interacting transcriptional regulator [Phycisphaerae bacterium]HSA27770.1 sigma 54-interacting transcriptional regulator [Phycisphaerae bacterium]